MPNPCDCPTAPILSGTGFGNLTKSTNEVVEYPIEWCARILPGASIIEDGWSVFPVTTPPLLAEELPTVGTVTSAKISGGVGGQLYKVEDAIRAEVGTDPLVNPVLTYSFTLWVYVPADNTPAVFVPCAEV